MMTRPPNTQLTSDVAREVCQRAHAKAYIGGSISALGEEYVLGFEGHVLRNRRCARRGAGNA
jgi:hypothetical protein